MRDDLPLIPMSQWGRDHWSTLAYVECRCADNGGWIEGDHMRTNLRRHRELVGELNVHIAARGSRYPTVLAEGHAPDGPLGEGDWHDDWDCLFDAERMGLLEIVDDVEKARRPFASHRIRVQLTDLGRRYASAARAHKQAGGSFATFRVTPIEKEP